MYALDAFPAISNIKRNCLGRNTKEAISRFHITLAFHTSIPYYIHYSDLNQALLSSNVKPRLAFLRLPTE